MNYNILLSHGIPLEDCLLSDYYYHDNEGILFVKLKATQRKCIHCNHTKTRIKEYKEKTIKSLRTGKASTTICLSLPRYICPNCKKTYTHNLNLFTSKSITKSLKDKLIEKFSTICTFKSIAKEHDLSLSEVINIFDESCPDLKVPFSEAICVDEFYNIRKSDFKYACLLLDFVTHKIIDIIPSRTTPYLDDYFKKIPLKIRDNVKYVITDMYDGYITMTHKWFRNAIIAIDPFHYMQYLTEAVQSVRRKILADDSKYFKDKSWMGKHWRLLTTNPKNYPNKNMTLKSGMTISYYDRVLNFVKQDRELCTAFLKLQTVYYELNKLTYEKAESYINHLINYLLSSNIHEFIKCGHTWNNYKEYIINSFRIFKGKRLTNGPIEGVNKRIKELKNIMAGYRNKNRFYKRIILIQNNKKGK